MKPESKAPELPELPRGYEWEMVHQCPKNIYNKRVGEKWLIRISWAMKGGRRRMLNLKDRYFDARDYALAYGVRFANEHAIMRKAKDSTHV